ncbi:trichohyalin-like isoform X3 [Acanthaster planci]|uniref:Trichohyalin-like isoform X3 n=1 Tax=Acanthaster planci TaxID=133434 RepID=A0A8B7ZV46_ACAPL|nr:trichohyalin-like isoform X3 [Acanthaster planci]
MADKFSIALVDLHVYLVPKEAWNEKYRSAYNDVIDQTISAGFVRVWPELSLYYLRNQILEQLGYDVLPTEYVFLRSVGRCLTQVKSRQEFELKVKNFIPPQTPLPEIFVMEAKRDPLNLASFTNHERIEVLEEETISPLMEESKGTGNNRTPESDAENTGTRHADSTSKQSAIKLHSGLLHVGQRDVGVQHAWDTSQTAHANHLPDISMGTPSPNQSPRFMCHHHNQSSHATHQHNANTKITHDASDPLHSTVVVQLTNNTPRSSSRIPHLTHRSSQTTPMPDLIIANSRLSSGSSNPSQGAASPPKRKILSTSSPPQKQILGSPQRSPPLSSNNSLPHLTPLPPCLDQTANADSSLNSTTNNSADSSGRVSTIILPSDPIINHSNPGLRTPPVSHPHSSQQVNAAPSSVHHTNPNSPFVDVSPPPARTSTNPPSEASSSAHWAIPQTYRAFHDEHQPSTCGTTPIPSQIPNITPGGVPPLNLHHLDAVKGMDPSTPLKSGRPDTYTNNTNEDSGIAEFTPDRNELDYGRQRSDSLERKQMAEKQQTPRTFEVNPKGRPEGLDSRLHSAEPEPLDRAHLQDSARQHPAPDNAAAVQEAERLREEERARQREHQIQEATAQEQAERQRQLESARRREAERWEKEKQEEEERQRLLKARQQELEMQRRQALAAQEAAAAQQAAATAKEKEEAAAALQQRLRDEAEERELEEEIRRRQADELRQSRQMSWDQARRRELEGVTPLSQQAGSSQQKDLYDPHARDSVRKEYTGDLSDRKTVGGGSTRQSERTQDSALLLDDAGSSVASNRDGTSAGEASEKTRQTTESAKERLETERERLIAELHERQTVRFDLERTREELMRQAKMLQSRTNDRRNKDEDLDSGLMTLAARDYWKKRYFEEKKKTNPLEEQVNRLRIQLDQQHRKLLNQLEGRGPNRRGMPREPPSKKNDHKILIFKLKHQIDDLKRRVENSKMKLTSEIKLRNQAETELRNLRSDVMQRKINVTVSRSQQLTTLKELEEKQGVRTTPLRGTGATSYTPRGTVKIGLK